MQWIPDPDLGEWRDVPPLGAIRLETTTGYPQDYRLVLRGPNGRTATVRTARSREDVGVSYWAIIEASNAYQYCEAP